MKIRLKILMLYVIIIFSCIFFNSSIVHGYGRVSQAWIETGGEKKLVFRTFANPYDSTVKEFYNNNSSSNILVGGNWKYIYNGVKYPAKWINIGNKGIELPPVNVYSTIGLMFHSKVIGVYNTTTTTSSSAKYGYNSYDSALSLNSQMESLVEVVKNSKATAVSSFSENSANRNTVFYELYSTTGNFKNVNWGTGLVLTNPTFTGYNPNTKSAIIEVNGTNVFVEEFAVSGDKLNEFIKAAKANKVSGSCYVSLINISKSFGATDTYEVIKTVAEFFKQYGKEGTSYWSSKTLGRDFDSKSLGAVANQYDNQLKLPQLSNRTVYVRHINVGNNTTINNKIVQGASRISSKNINENYLILKNGLKLYGEPSATYQEVYDNDNIDIEQSMTKKALTSEYYKCIGYNATNGVSANSAILALNNKINSGTMQTLPLSNSVTINAKSVNDDSDYTMIDLYYTEFDKQVVVNHIYLDKNNNIMDKNSQTIEVKDLVATMIGKGEQNGKNIVRENADTFTRSVYVKKLGYGIRVSKSDAVQNADYVGFEEYNKQKNIEYGKNIDISELDHSESTVITGNLVQINFYYKRNDNIENPEPVKDIGGNLFVQAEEVNTVCTDSNDVETNVSVLSIPSGTKVKVGIENIPKYIVGAINAQQVTTNVANYIQFMIKTSDGKLTNYRVPYNIAYYIVKDLLVYELNNMTVYDTDSGEQGVSGGNLFNWKSLNVNTDVNAKLTMIGINGKQIQANNLGNINNYVAATIKTNNGTEYNIVLANAETSSSIPLIEIPINSSQLSNFKLNLKVQNMNIEISNGSKTTKLFKDTAKEVEVDLSKYVMNAMGEVSGGTINLKIDKANVNKEVYNSVDSTKITASDIKGSSEVLKDIANGIRLLTGKATYTTKFLIKNTNANEVADNVYYEEKSNDTTDVTFKLSTNKNISKYYKVDMSATTLEQKYKYVKPVNVYTPITVSANIMDDDNKSLNQMIDGKTQAAVIQANTPFKIEFNSNSQEGIYRLSDTNKFAGGYYIKFDFDVHKVKINGKLYNSGSRIKAGNWIGIIPKNNSGKTYIEVQAYGNTDSNTVDVITEDNGSYTVRAVAYNATDYIKEQIKSFPSISDIKNSALLADLLNNICYSPSYIAEASYPIVILNRIYDFKITDLKDISWKNIFRSTAVNATNKHTGIVYYSGITKWNNNSTSDNSIVNRGTLEVGRNPLRILPLGPYKNTDTTYLKAPKLGYRFSYDMKVTGSYFDNNGNVRDNKKVKISTKFYYLSKDGKTYLSEYDGKTEGIYLFYKNSSGKYVKIDEKGGGYNLYFTPNDGYRYIEDSVTSTLSTKEVLLGSLRNITLTSNMATISNNYSVITYYGEYKLPNSTIAVKVNSNGKYDINKPLTDGYIGVIFDIQAYAGSMNVNGTSKDIVLSYSKDVSDLPNSSQWDCEGFLGYTGYGKVISEPLRLKLEKGYFNITNDIYNSIKGTVILYDTDLRADTDYE